ncbi:3-hydroxyacyl-CoA dehydrogenase [Agromyces aerolatus]|uniref:3-hydroxyacyl-CoA dehydrogenase n=1 Tax=Agromyces sp. LY-1074 TaxID=3074080 RepID=UPI00285B176A|nr:MULTISPECIES: 3-hydroxyacyl-CoA dehydrogenase [unclassified Agromyces]MDR5700510.1 3-hydroxyacyl-CoA dehydrogenase [Agromyces sp. LY-1074]MDR5707031.1 3-hydroxyacyl-CoA dehydrogenase [Agromyces sp. LY-1358]
MIPQTSEPAPEPDDAPIALIGAGTIGVGWAIVFAGAGRTVRVYDRDPAMLAGFPEAMGARLSKLDEAGLLDEAPAAIIARTELHDQLELVLEGVGYVQENVSESIDVKRDLFATLDRLAPPAAVLASSTSTIPSSRFTEGLPGRRRCLVVHPANPPYLMHVAEVVPSAATTPEAIETTVELLRSVAMKPVVVRAELEGFVFNRLQGALLREAYFLVRDGVVSPSEIDLIVREGLGRRWSITGPFATSELNTRGGTARHAESIGSVYARIGRDRGAADPWSPETVAHIVAEMQRILPDEDWDENVLRRESGLIALEVMRRRGELPAVPADA